MTAAGSTGFTRSPLRSAQPARSLHADELGIGVPADALPADLPIDEATSATPEIALLPLEIEDEDAVLLEVHMLLAQGYAGVIFFGPPGTSKSWYATQVASALADREPARVRQIQFHQSYEYSDFVEGWAPAEGGGFVRNPKHLLLISEDARQDPENIYVLVIEELSRSDPARVFGEALSYLETSRRNEDFYLASGRRESIPPNLVVLATMNPFDRGVDEVDAAFERRFAKIAMEPSVKLLRKLLAGAGMAEELQGRVEKFFLWINRHPNEQAHIGHALFRGVANEEQLDRLWRHQLRFQFDKAFKLNRNELPAVVAEWKAVTPADTILL